MAKAGRRKGGYSQAARLLRLLDLLGSRRYGTSISELASELGVTVRQMRRDLDAIEEAGHGLETVEASGRSAVRLAGNRALAIRLTQRERYALLAVGQAFDVFEDTPFHEDVKSILTKVQASLPIEEQRELENLGERLTYLPDGGTKLYRGKEDVIDALFTGVLRRCRVRTRYRGAATKASDRLLEPYAIVLYRQGLYAIGRAVDEDGELGPERTYAVERFTRAEHVRGSRFKTPADFDVHQYFQGAFGVFRGGDPEKVVVDFSAAGRALVEARRWHPSQKLRRLPGGEVRLELRVSDLTQVAQWVIGWGPLARVREPRALVERVVREHKEALAQYRK